MSHYLSPLRFARVFEMDRNGFPMCGSLEEQQQVRDAILNYAEWDGPYDRALFALTKATKLGGRNFIAISLFHQEGRVSFWGMAGGAVIQLFPTVPRVAGVTEWAYVLTHEIGHVIGWKLFNPAETTGRWAVDFQWWVMNGQPESGWVYERLAAIGAQETVVVPR